MLLFCPSCSNTLRISPIQSTECAPNETHLAGKNRFECRTCPYQMLLDCRYYDRKTFEQKPVEDVMGGKEAWEHADRTEVRCESTSCESKQAYFRQVQIRSADEPMTSFFRCVECAHEWRE